MNPADAAVHAGRRLGLTVGTPEPLRSTNNTVIWLAPSPVVVKIGPLERLERELRVTRALSVTDAPVVSPAPALPTVVHIEAGHAMTFWEYIPQSSDRQVAPAALAAHLAQLHDRLAVLAADVTRSLPNFTEEVEVALQIIHEPEVSRRLPAGDGDLLKRAGERAWAAMSRTRSSAALHGSPHDYNVLATGAGEPLFIDLETVCTGPIEWDLAHQSDAVARAYPSDIDPRLLRDCRFAVSFKTAAFCWTDPDRGDLRSHATLHTARIAHEMHHRAR